MPRIACRLSPHLCNLSPVATDDDAVAPPERPAWSAFIVDKRESQSRSVRQAALSAGMSHTNWLHLERGHKRERGEWRAINPQRGTLLQVAEALRLRPADRDQLFALAGLEAPRRRASVPVGYDVDASELTKAEVAELNRLADLFRASRRQGP